MNLEETRDRAKDENTTPEVLEELAQHSDRLTRKYVAGNPNTPTEILFVLGAEFPQALLNNPIFDLLLLENPNLVADLPIGTLQSLVKQENIPDYFIVECAEREYDKDLLLSIVINPKLSRQILDKLARSKFFEVVEAARLHINYSGKITEGYHEIAKSKLDERIRDICISNKYLTKYFHQYLETITQLGLVSNLVLEIFLQYYRLTQNDTLSRSSIYEQARKSLYSKIIHNLASSRFAKVEILAKLATIDELRPIIAKNSSISQNLIEELVKDNNLEIKKAIAANPNITKAVINKLIKDNNIEIRKAIAANPNTPEEILLSIVQQDCDRVLEGIAANPGASIEMLEFLFTRELNYSHHCLLAANTHTPTHILEIIIELHPEKNERSELYRNMFRYSPNLPVKIIEEAIESDFLLCYLICNIAIPWKLYQKVINKKPEYQDWLAKHPDVPQELLTKFTMGDKKNKISAANHPCTSINLLTKLAKDNDPYIRFHVAKNPNTPLDIALEIFKNFPKQDIKILYFILEEYLKKNSKKIHCVIAELLKHNLSPLERPILLFNDQLLPDTCRKYSQSLSWLGRYAISCNLNTPEDIIQQLTNDSNKIVRAAARGRVRSKK